MLSAPISPAPAIDISWVADRSRFALHDIGPDSVELSVDEKRVAVLSMAAWASVRAALTFLSNLEDVDHAIHRRECNLAEVNAKYTAGGPSSDDIARAPAAPPSVPARVGTSRRGKLWTDEEEQRLLSAWDAGENPSEIARALERGRGAVTARLFRLGRIDEDGAQLRWPSSRSPAPPLAGSGEIG